MSYRDTSADTTLDNANEGIMSSDFEKWWKESGIEFASIFETGAAKKGWNARQPEIDALKVQVEYYKQYVDGVSDQLREANKAANALKAEVLKLSGYRDKYLWALEENGSLCAELELLRSTAMKDFSTTSL